MDKITIPIETFANMVIRIAEGQAECAQDVAEVLRDGRDEESTMRRNILFAVCRELGIEI